jgi:phage tail-like protein
MGDREDVLTGFHFIVEVGPITGMFTEVSGIGSESEVIEHKVTSEGAQESLIRKIPGRLTWGDITLKRGITSNMDFYDWRAQVEQGAVADARMDGSVIMVDQSLNPVARWNFTAGWPSKIDGPSFTSDANTYGIEELTIVHEGIERVQ